MNKIEQIADCKINLHKNVYNDSSINCLEDNIVEAFTENNIDILTSFPNNNIIAFSVNTTDQNIISECIYNGYSKFFSSLDITIPKDILIDDLYNLTILPNVDVDRTNVLLIL